MNEFELELDGEEFKKLLERLEKLSKRKPTQYELKILKRVRYFKKVGL